MKIVLVVIGWRPRGSSRNVEVSRSPYTVSATVRGIGVAVITSRCGVIPLRGLGAQPVSLLDPETVLLIDHHHAELVELHRILQQAWVPMTMPASPAAISARTYFFCAVVIDPVSSATRAASSAPPSWPPMANGPRTSVIDRTCCAASTSVGASSAHW